MEPTKKELQKLVASMPQVEVKSILTDEQEKALIRKFQNGYLDALAELLDANIHFVVTIAKIYQNKGLNTPELIAAGTEGLVLAAEKYPCEEDFRFLSYAIFWIRQSIIEKINNCK